MVKKRKKSVCAGEGDTEQTLSAKEDEHILVRTTEMRLAANQGIWEMQILKSQMRCHYILYVLKIFRPNNIKCRRRHGEIGPRTLLEEWTKVPLWRS